MKLDPVVAKIRTTASKIFGLALVGLVALLVVYWPRNFDKIHIAIILLAFIAGIAAGTAQGAADE